MNVKEFAMISSAIKACYPWANVMPDDVSTDIWYGMLKDLDYKVVSNAVQSYIATNKMPPSIADIRELSSQITSIKVLDYGEAWETVLKAIRRYGYMQEIEALESLDDLTRKCVRRIGWQNICMSENIVADRANFRMMYEQEQQQQKKLNQIPMSVNNRRNELASVVNETILKIDG